MDQKALFALPYPASPVWPSDWKKEYWQGKYSGGYIITAQTHETPDGQVLEAAFWTNEERPKPEYRQFVDKHSVWIAQMPDGRGTRKVALNGWIGKDYNNAYGARAVDEAAESLICVFFGEPNEQSYRLLWNLYANEREKKRAGKRARLLAATAALQDRVPDLPVNIEKWVRDYVLPGSRYLMYRKNRRGVNIAYCTYCGQTVELPDAKHNDRQQCPTCKTMATVKADGIGRAGTVDEEQFAILQNDGHGGLWLRCYDVRRNHAAHALSDDGAEVAPILRAYPGGETGPYRTEYYEYQRAWLGNNEVRIWRSRGFFGCSSGTWMRKYRDDPVELEPDTKKAAFYNYLPPLLYARNMGSVFRGTRYAYSDFTGYLRHWRSTHSNRHTAAAALRYLVEFARWPQLEYMRRQGFTTLVEQIVNGKNPREIIISPKAKKLTGALGIDGNDMAIMRALDPDEQTLRRYRLLRQAGVRGAGMQMRGLADMYIGTGQLERLLELGAEDFPRVVAYIKKQRALAQKKKHHAGINEYIDYMRECADLGYDFADRMIRFPRDLYEAHMRTAAIVAEKRDAKTSAAVAKRAKEYNGRYGYSDGNYILRAVGSLGELITEGKTLNHCVGGFGKRIAEGTAIIMVLRRAEAPDEPFYTMEIGPKSGKIVQTRGKGNCAMTQEVGAFVQAFSAARLEKKKRKARKTA